MFWLGFVVSSLLPLILPLGAPWWSSHAAGVGVAVGLVFWLLDRENSAVRLLPVVGLLAGSASLWITGMFVLWPSVLLPGGALGLVYAAAARRSSGDPGPVVLGGVGGVLIGALFLLGGGSGGGGSVGSASRIVIFGDSLTAGVPDDGVERRWPEVLGGKLGGGAEVIAHAHPGDTASASLKRWRDVLAGGRWHPSDPAWEPDLVILLLGGNDILRRAGREALQRDLEAWAGALQPHRGVQVLLIEVPSNLLTGAYSGTWSSVARGREDFFWMNDRTLRGIFSDRSKTLADGIHLNQAGHNALAAGVHARLME